MTVRICRDKTGCANLCTFLGVFGQDIELDIQKDRPDVNQNRQTERQVKRQK